MAVNFKTLRSFVMAVDTSSVSAAAQALKMAQPALSQQIASLESHFAQKLLLRSNTGVVPTAAGRELYRHAQLILEQLDRAERDVARHGGALSGSVSVGLATYSTTSILSTPLLKAVRDYLRRLIDSAFQRAQVPLRVTAEIESAATLREAIDAGLGATILPWALTNHFSGPARPVIRRVVAPSIETSVSLCVSAQQPLSEPARVVRDILESLVRELLASGRCVGIRAPLNAGAAAG